MKALEIGSHTKLEPKSDWTLLDLVPGGDVDVVADAAKPLPFEPLTFDLVYASHILEHIAWTETVRVLADWRRVLRHGGRIEIWVPDFEKIVKAYFAGKPGDDFRRFNPDGDLMTWVNGKLFFYGPDGGNGHRACFDEAHLERCLRAAGYFNIDRLPRPRGYDHGPINLGIGATAI